MEKYITYLKKNNYFLWDRKLIKSIFNFDYTWEIYTPIEKRKYGYYTLPIIYDSKFLGRVEILNDRKTKTLIVKNIWYEDCIKLNKKIQLLLDDCIKRFAKFNECNTINFINI